MVLLLMPILDTADILDLLDTLDTVPMVPILMLVLMVATTLARGLLMLSPRLMLMPTMVPMDTLHMVLLLMHILDTVDILDLLDTLDTVPMLPILMLVHMVVTTLVRGLLMLSPRLMLTPTMVPMDTLHMVLLLMPILDTVDIRVTVHMPDTHTLMVPTLPMAVIAISDKKEASILCSMNNNNFTQKLSMQRKPQQDEK